MTPTEVTTILRQYNEWFRGSDDALRPTTKEIGEAIDAAVEMIERLEKVENALRKIAGMEQVDVALYPHRPMQVAREALEESE